MCFVVAVEAVVVVVVVAGRGGGRVDFKVTSFVQGLTYVPLLMSVKFTCQITYTGQSDSGLCQQ